MVAISKFPKNPTGGQLYIDSTAVQWRFDAARSRWVQQSIFEDLPVVTSEVNGLISPEVYKRLQLLQTASQQIDMTTFKISPGLDAYYYYFYSPDGLIDINYRGDGVISIDVNEQKLVSYMYRNLCIGDRGPRGEPGIDGEPGVVAPNEPIFNPTRVNASTITGEAYVPLPIGTYYPHQTITPISLRFHGLYATPNEYSIGDQLSYWVEVIGNTFSSNEEKTVFSRMRQRVIDQSVGATTGPPIKLSNVIINPLQLNPSAILEIDIDPISGTFIIINNGVGATNDGITVKFDKEIGYLQYSVQATWPTAVVTKVRQRGPIGDQGNIPSGFITQQDCVFPNDANVRPDTALVHLRLDCDTNTFYVGFDRLPSQDAFQLISTDAGVATTITQPFTDGRYAAVEKTAGAIKAISTLSNDFADIDIDDPHLQNWEPQPGCHTRRSFESHKFDWISDTDIEECAEDLTWYGPEGVRPGKYPYKIVLPSPPPGDQCCQDDYFIFPETGDC